MNIKDQKTLQSLFDLGYKVVISGHPFEDTFVNDMGREDYELETDTEESYRNDINPFIYTDENTEGYLNDVSIHDVKVYKEVHLRNEEPEQQEEISYE